MLTGSSREKLARKNNKSIGPRIDSRIIVDKGVQPLSRHAILMYR